MSLRSRPLLVVMTVVAGGVAAFGSAGAAYALPTPSIGTSQQPGSVVVGSPIADKATVSGGSSSFSCPPQDEAGFHLETFNTSTNPIFCSYPAFPGENPTDFFCEYSASTGTIVTDHDAGFCPTNAVPNANLTGTVTFKLYNNNSGSGTPLFTDTENLVSGVATSASYTAAATGTDYWVATYNGDINNNPVTSSNSSEPVTITPASPSLSGSGGGSVTAGSSISDSAKIGGGYSPGGSVSFALFGGGGCTGTQVGSTTTVPVSGDKTYPSGSIATPASAGTYSVLVSYAPDANNNAPPKVCDPYVVMQAPGPPPPPASAPAAPPPSLSGLSQSHRRWRLGSNLARFAAASKPPVGTTFQFTLNEAATVQFAFAKLLPGRNVNGKCVAQTRRNRRHKACNRSVPSGSLSFSAGVGLHKLFFQGRLTGTEKLKPGTYALTITATNAAGQGTTNPLSFAIVPG